MTSLYILNPAFLDAVNDGLTRAELADRFGVNYQTVCYTAKKYGLPISRAGKGYQPTTDYSRVTELREQGWTYQKIGDELNISRERVRQILHIRGRSDLCYRQTGPRIERGNCINCGASLDGKTHFRGERKYCTRDCLKKHAARTLSPRERQIMETVLQRRFLDKPPSTWRAIGEELGVAGPAVHNTFKRACIKTGIDWSIAARGNA